jgi:hypothetical protein
MSINGYVRSFPMFDNIRNKLVAMISSGQITNQSVNKEKIVAQIFKLSYDHLVQLSLIIIHYTFIVQPTHNAFTPELCDPKKKGKNILPYGIVISPGGKGFSIDLNQVPMELLLMIYTYLLPSQP